MRLAIPLLVVAMLVFAAQKLGEPSGQALLLAIDELGLTGGWRCAQSATYVYDPRRERPDSAVVAEPPEALVPRDVQAVRVEVGLRGADTTVWTVPSDADRDARPNRVFVLSAGALRAISLEPPASRTTICNSHLRDWHIVGDNALE